MLGVILDHQPGRVTSDAGGAVMKRATQAAPCDTDRHSDAAQLLRLIEEHGPTTCGAAASDPGWFPTRAWRAEDQLSRAGLIHYSERDGRMHLRR